MEVKKLSILILSLYSFVASAQQVSRKKPIDLQIRISKESPKDLENRQFQEILTKELMLLDDASTSLSLLGQQVYNNSNISTKDKALIKTWIGKIFTAINDQKNIINKIDEKNIIDLLDITVTDNALLNFTTRHINSNFTTIQQLSSDEYDLDGIVSERSKLIGDGHIDDVRNIQEMNRSALKQLQDAVNNVGLTKINLLARAIDRLNDKYQISKALSYLPVATVGIGTILYYCPESWIDRLNISLLSSFKRNYLGTASWTSNLGKTKDKTPAAPAVPAASAAPANTNISANTASPDLNAASPANQANPDSSNSSNSSSAKTKRIGENLEDLAKDKGLIGTVTLFAALGAYALGDNSLLPASLNKYIGKMKSSYLSFWENLQGIKKTPNRSYQIINDITLDDERLIGIESQVDELKQLVNYITNPELFDKSNAAPSKGILLEGPSRCGKTHTARALAGSINKALKANENTKNLRLGFKEIDFLEVVSNKDLLTGIIEQARASAPCILFIDEMHNIPLQTKDSITILTEFLTALDKLNSSNNGVKSAVIVVAATNKAELLDSALIQAGRFGKVITFEKPNFEQRKRYFEVHCKYHYINTENIDLDLLAKETQGCTYGDLNEIIKSGKNLARNFGTRVKQEYMQQDIDKRSFRIKNETPNTPQEQKIVSAHLAGQALARILLDTPESPNKSELLKVTINKRIPKIVEKRLISLTKENQNKYKAPYGKIFSFNRSESTKIETDEQKIQKCKILLAGSIAQELLLKANSNYRANEKQKAYNIIEKIVMGDLDSNCFTESVKAEIKQEILKYFNQYKEEVKELLSTNLDALKNIASMLETKHSLTAQEIKQAL